MTENLKWDSFGNQSETKTTISREEFLKLFPNYIIVAGRFKANKDGNGLNIKHNISLAEAEGLNELNGKRDIFFTPNGDFKTIFWDSDWGQKGRSEKNVVASGWNIYSLNADNDKNQRLRENIWLKPTIINKTKRWYHMFFLLKNPVSYKEYVTRRKALEKKLEALLGADPTDIARILRIPWFKYWADNLWEFEIEMEEYNPDEVRTFDEREEIIDHLYDNICKDEQEKELLKKQHKWRKFGKVVDDMFYEIQDRVSAADVLCDLYTQFEVKQWWEIRENGKRTRWYKYVRAWNYVNNFSTDDPDVRPRWGPFHIAKRHYKSMEKVVEYFWQKRWIKIDDFRKMSSGVNDLVTHDTKNLPGEKEREMLRFGSELEWILFYFKKKEIRGYSWDASDVPFVKCMIVPLWKVIINNSERYAIRIEKADGSEYVTLLPISGTLTEFRRFLQAYGVMVQDKSKFFTVLYEYIYWAKGQYHYTNKLWMQIIWGKKVIINKWWTYIDEENSIYVSIDDTRDSSIIVEDWIIDPKRYVENLLKWYDWQVSIPVFLTLILWVNAWFFRNIKAQLPQSFVFWLSQAGKTTLLKHLFRSFWITKDLSASSKAFVYEKYARHYMPTHFSEYRHSAHKQSDQLEWLLRNLFDGDPILKGRADQSTIEYESNGLYMIDWQSIFTDDAAQTRMIMLMGNKRYMGKEDYLINLPNAYRRATEVFKDVDDFQKFIKLSRDKRPIIRKKVELLRMDNRTIQNYSYLYALLDWLWLSEHEHFVTRALQEQDWLTAQDDIQTIYQKIFNLQVINRFDASIYKWWLVINVIEEGMRMNFDMKDLKWFIQTINANFLGITSFGWLTTYVDFEYVFSKPALHWSFFRMLDTVSIDWQGKTEEELTTIRALREFVKQKCPWHSMIQELNFEANFNYKKDVSWGTSQQTSTDPVF